MNSTDLLGRLRETSYALYDGKPFPSYFHVVICEDAIRELERLTRAKKIADTAFQKIITEAEHVGDTADAFQEIAYAAVKETTP